MSFGPLEMEADMEKMLEESPLCAHARTRFAGLVPGMSHTRHLNGRPLKQSKVGALPQTPPGAEPLDLDTQEEQRLLSLLSISH
jgi:hypothetical protein